MKERTIKNGRIKSRHESTRIKCGTMKKRRMRSRKKNERFLRIRIGKMNCGVKGGRRMCERMKRKRWKYKGRRKLKWSY